MPLSPARLRLSAVAGLALVLGLATGVTAAPSPASPVTPSLLATAAPAGPGELTVTLVLTPGDAARLDHAAALARRGGVSRVERLADVAAAAPSAASRVALAQRLESAGFRVSGDDWTLHATGARASLARWFGVHLSSTADGHTVADRQPRLPSGVTAVLGFDDRPVVRDHASAPFSPSGFRAAYALDRPVSTGRNTTVATVQFSGWDRSGLSNYASANSIPFSNSQLTQVSVDNADPTAVSGTGDLEVSLDQETILGAAPSAAQRAYFGPNTAQGFVDTYTQLAADAASTSITAASTSWGQCEAGSNTAFKNAVSTVISRLVATGTTFFAASGDQGSIDCTTSMTPNNTPAVDFPASLAATVGVGGTTLTQSGSAYSETAWSGSGGGQSTSVARPSYQGGLSISGTKRLVPDVSSDADPNTGAIIYVGSTQQQVGGTSLAAPQWAAQLAASLSSLGCSAGVGDIHALLYASTSLKDITSGNNGGFSAGTGYDEVTGLGTPVWRNLARELEPTAGCAGGTYTALTPSRILDTRNGTGAPQAPLGAGQTLALTVLGVGGVPSTGVSAVAINTTVTAPTVASGTNGYLTVWPAGAAQPNASNLNFVAGQTVANLVEVGVGTGGAINIYNASGTTQVIGDVVGYYASAASTTVGARYVALSPARILDTRNGTGAAQAQVGAGGTVTLQVTGAGGVPTANVAAVAVNITAVNATAVSYVTVYQSGVSRPTASTLNTTNGATVPNLAISGVSSDGKIMLYNDGGSVDLLVDVDGYFLSSAGTSAVRYEAVTPTRLVDTRVGTGAPKAPLGAGQTLTASVVGVSGIPSQRVTSVTVNVTAVSATQGTYLTVYPSGESQPNASNLNVAAGQTVPNLVISKVGSDGKLAIFNASGTSDLLVDIVGYSYS